MDETGKESVWTGTLPGSATISYRSSARPKARQLDFVVARWRIGAMGIWRLMMPETKVVQARRNEIPIEAPPASWGELAGLGRNVAEIPMKIVE